MICSIFHAYKLELSFKCYTVATYFIFFWIIVFKHIYTCHIHDSFLWNVITYLKYRQQAPCSSAIGQFIQKKNNVLSVMATWYYLQKYVLRFWSVMLNFGPSSSVRYQLWRLCVDHDNLVGLIYLLVLMLISWTFQVILTLCFLKILKKNVIFFSFLVELETFF